MPERFTKDGETLYHFDFWEFEKLYRSNVLQFEEGTVISLDNFTVVCPRSGIEYFEHLLEEHGLPVTVANAG